METSPNRRQYSFPFLWIAASLLLIAITVWASEDGELINLGDSLEAHHYSMAFDSDDFESLEANTNSAKRQANKTLYTIANFESNAALATNDYWQASPRGPPANTP